MAEEPREALPPAPADPTQEAGDAVIARHREALLRQFPIPDEAELAPRKPSGGTLAALAVCLGIGVVWWDPAYRSEHHATEVGARRELALADGTRVVMDADSRVSVDWRLRSREVSLERGRARFEVSASVMRPFYVGAGATSVRVVGTTFDVQRMAARVAVTVVEGRVAVTPGADTQARLLLLPGYRVVVDGGVAGRPATVDIVARTAWSDGRLEFDRTPLAEALAELQRYLPQPVTLDDPKLAALEVSGVFDSARAAEVLDLLPHILPVQVVRERGGGARIVAR